MILTEDICFLCSFLLPSSAIYHFYVSEGHGVMQYEAMNGIKLHILHWFSIVSIIYNVGMQVSASAGSLCTSVLAAAPGKPSLGDRSNQLQAAERRQKFPKVSSLMGEAVGKWEGEGKLRDGDMRGAGKKPEKGWKERQKERRERKGAGPTARLSISGKLLFACLTKEEEKEICGKAPQAPPASLPRRADNSSHQRSSAIALQSQILWRSSWGLSCSRRGSGWAGRVFPGSTGACHHGRSSKGWWVGQEDAAGRGKQDAPEACRPAGPSCTGTRC